MVAGLGRADEVVLTDVKDHHHLTKALRIAIGQGLRRQALGQRRLLHFQAVLIGSCQKEHVLAVETLEARNGVRGERRVGVADVRHTVWIKDRCRDVELLFAAHVAVPPWVQSFSHDRRPRGRQALTHSAAPPRRPGARAKSKRGSLKHHGFCASIEKARVAYHEKADSATGNSRQQKPPFHGRARASNRANKEVSSALRSRLSSAASAFSRAASCQNSAQAGSRSGAIKRAASACSAGEPCPLARARTSRASRSRSNSKKVS